MANGLTYLRNLLLPLLLSLGGCVILPIQHDSIEDPALLKIKTAFASTVEQTLNDPEQQWTSGWLGNMWVNFHGEENRGLCYEWKYRVHAGVKETVTTVNWQATGIVINQGAEHEHHAVIVFDPDRIPENKLLSSSQAQPAYVLDAWRNGKADIYHLSDWLQLAQTITVAAKIIPINPK